MTPGIEADWSQAFPGVTASRRLGILSNQTLEFDGSENDLALIGLLMVSGIEAE